VTIFATPRASVRGDAKLAELEQQSASGEERRWIPFRPMAGERIEQRPRLRDEHPPDDSVVVVRGGPDTAGKIAKHAARTARAWTLDGDPLVGISVFCALDPAGEACIDGILSTMRSYRIVHLARVGNLRAADYELLATATRPHYTLRSAGGGILVPDELLVVLGDPQPNPFYPRGLERPGGEDAR
jgi:hypothetical protein